MTPEMPELHPELAGVARFIPPMSMTSRKVKLLRRLTRLRGVPRVPKRADVLVSDIEVPGDDGTTVRVRMYTPAAPTGPVPALLWLHPGGYIMGTAQMDQANNIAIVRELGIAVASVDYRLAPEDPFPAALNDSYTALGWLHEAAESLCIRADRIAVGGASAGGGLAAALVQKAYDLGEFEVVFQLLIYPMLDDRTVVRPDLEARQFRVWSTESNEFAWRAYLGSTPGLADAAIAPYAVPSRRKDLAGLPPAWIGVGTLDQFHAEDVEYASRLNASGVHCELMQVDGAYHGFDVVSRYAKVARDFRSEYLAALEHSLFWE